VYQLQIVMHDLFLCIYMSCYVSAMMGHEFLKDFFMLSIVSHKLFGKISGGLIS
jgi:hypothetical protein